jgi:hypothetical protein
MFQSVFLLHQHVVLRLSGTLGHGSQSRPLSSASLKTSAIDVSSLLNVADIQAHSKSFTNLRRREPPRSCQATVVTLRSTKKLSCMLSLCSRTWSVKCLLRHPIFDSTFFPSHFLPTLFISLIYPFIFCLHLSKGGRGSVVCTATRYGLDGPGIESRVSMPAQIGPEPGSYTMGTVSHYRW